MKTKHLILSTMILLSVFTFSHAQSLDEMVKDWERAKAYTKEYLDAMPESGYAFKPTPEMRSFAEQVLHLTDANYGFVATATGVTPPVKDLEKQQRISRKHRLPNWLWMAMILLSTASKVEPCHLAGSNQIIWPVRYGAQNSYRESV